jgi:hypothetical protein
MHNGNSTAPVSELWRHRRQVAFELLQGKGLQNRARTKKTGESAGGVENEPPLYLVWYTATENEQFTLHSLWKIKIRKARKS